MKRGISLCFRGSLSYQTIRIRFKDKLYSFFHKVHLFVTRKVCMDYYMIDTSCGKKNLIYRLK